MHGMPQGILIATALIWAWIITIFIFAFFELRAQKRVAEIANQRKQVAISELRASFLAEHKEVVGVVSDQIRGIPKNVQTLSAQGAFKAALGYVRNESLSTGYGTLGRTTQHKGRASSKIRTARHFHKSFRGEKHEQHVGGELQ